MASIKSSCADSDSKMKKSLVLKRGAKARTEPGPEVEKTVEQSVAKQQDKPSKASAEATGVIPPPSEKKAGEKMSYADATKTGLERKPTKVKTAAESAPTDEPSTQPLGKTSSEELFDDAFDVMKGLAELTGMSVDELCQAEAETATLAAPQDTAAKVEDAVLNFDKMSIDEADGAVPPQPAAKEADKSDFNQELVKTLQAVQQSMAAQNKRLAALEGRLERDEPPKRPKPDDSSGGGRPQGGGRGNGPGRGGGAGRGRGNGGGRGGGDRGAGRGKSNTSLSEFKQLAREFSRCYKCGRYYGAADMPGHREQCQADVNTFKRNMGKVKALKDRGEVDKINVFPTNGDK